MSAFVLVCGCMRGLVLFSLLDLGWSLRISTKSLLAHTLNIAGVLVLTNLTELGGEGGTIILFDLIP